MGLEHVDHVLMGAITYPQVPNMGLSVLWQRIGVSIFLASAVLCDKVRRGIDVAVTMAIDST